VYLVISSQDHAQKKLQLFPRGPKPSANPAGKARRAALKWDQRLKYSEGLETTTIPF